MSGSCTLKSDCEKFAQGQFSKTILSKISIAVKYLVCVGVHIHQIL